MRFHKADLLLAVLLCLCAGVHAENEQNEKNAAEAAKKLDGPLSKDEKDYYKDTQRLNTLTTRIEEADKQFNELVRRKASEKNSAEIQRILKAMNETNKDRNKSVDEYNKVKADVELRFPNQGAHLNRRYQTQTKKSIEEMEGAAGLDELLTRTKKVVDKKYAPFAAKDDPAKKAKAEAPKPAEEPEKRLRLEK